MTDRARFEKFCSPVPVTGCWLWTGSVHKEGYGRFRYRSQTAKAHRVAYEFYCGPIPAGKIVCHRCDVPSCVNPDHLFLGTDQDNAADKSRKGRGAKKLTADKVRDIRMLLAAGAKHQTLADRFGVSRSMITMISLNYFWKDH